MTPEAMATLKKIGGVVGLVVVTVATMTLIAPQLVGTLAYKAALHGAAAVGLLFLLAASIKGIAERD